MNMQRTGTIHHLQTVLREAQGFEGYFALLPAMLVMAETAMDEPGMDAGRMNEMAGYLAEIRFLLSEIERYGGPEVDTLEVLRLARRYRDLEGRLKERRNDRSSTPGMQSAPNERKHDRGRGR